MFGGYTGYGSHFGKSGHNSIASYIFQIFNTKTTFLMYIAILYTYCFLNYLGAEKCEVCKF